MNKNKLHRQIELENHGLKKGLENNRKRIENFKENYHTAVGNILTYQLTEPLKIEILKVFNHRLKGIYSDIFKRMLDVISPDLVAMTTVKTLINSILKDNARLSTLSIAISDGILFEINTKLYKATDNAAYVEVIKTHNRSKIKRKFLQSEVNKLMRKNQDFDLVTLETESKVWLGNKLIDCFIQSTGLVKIINEYDGKTQKLVVKPTKELLELISKVKSHCELFNPLMLPMLVKPKDHTPTQFGGFLSDNPLLNYPIVKGGDKYLKNLELENVYKCINTLQKTAWKINKKVYDVFKTIYLQDVYIPELDLPPIHYLELPIKPWGDNLSAEEFEEYKSKNPEIVRAYSNEARKIYKKNEQLSSKRFLMTSLISNGELLKDEEDLYFCYQMDWRGRVYPVQNTQLPHPQGIDLSKALLTFKHGVKLGKSGGAWLSFHGANCYGLDKESLDFRQKWAYENTKQILEVATDPYNNKWWWNADKPWRFLAFCFEWQEFANSNYAESFYSSLPVSVDGSCSGIQHFSGLLLDTRGAKATNVINSTEKQELQKPADIYQEVANEVKKILKADSVVKNDPLATFLLDKINRSVVKRNTMTTPYGVKFIGMKEQLMAELNEDTFTPLHLDISFISVCNYLAKVNKQAISNVVTSSKDVMDWLKGVGQIMAEANKIFYWTTPAGFKVRQCYIKHRDKKIDCWLGSTRYRLTIKDPTRKLDHLKTIQGIAPNFIHSLDGSHLMLTVIKAHSMGVKDFAVVHDSFGTQAGMLDTLNKALRKSFIEIYSKNVLEDFAKQIKEQIKDEDIREKIPPLPKRGSLNIKDVMNSVYIFS